MKRILLCATLVFIAALALSARAQPAADLFAADSIQRYANGSIASGTLAKDATIQGYALPAGAWLRFTPDGALALADDLPKGTKIMGFPVRIVWFRPDGGIWKMVLAKKHRFEGKKYKAGDYVFFGAGAPVESPVD